jgi:hypothetical protein
MHLSCDGPDEPKRGAPKRHFLSNYLSVFPNSEKEAKAFPAVHRLATTKAPVSRDTFWNLIVGGVDSGEIQVNRANVNEPKYWVRAPT